MPDSTSAPRLAPPDPALPALEQLREVVAKLRGPGGCPWDREQTHQTLRAGLLEEAYEVVAAINAGDDENLREELGDLLLQVVFHAQLAAEDGRFCWEDVPRGIVQKLVRRHPHVFAGEALGNTAEVLVRWDEIKRQEKVDQGGKARASSVLDGVAGGLPALLHAQKVQKKVARLGFDWPDAAPIVAKVREELAELEAALAAGQAGEVEDELGDVLFSVVNLARALKVEAEVALAGSTAKFTRRFQAMEVVAHERGLALEKLTLAEMDVLWDEVKQAARGG